MPHHVKTAAVTVSLLTLMATQTGQAQTSAPRARSTSNVVVTHGATGSYLGVAVLEIDAERAKTLKLKEERGVEVKIVDENSPASKAGLKEGDVVLEYNGQRIEGIAQFIRMVSETPAGRKATLLVSRNGSPLTLPVTVEARAGRGGFSFSTNEVAPFPPVPPVPPVPPIPAIPVPEMPWTTPRLGIETESLSGQLAEYFGVREGVLVRHVSKGGAADRAGLKAGDVVIKVNGDSVRNAREISAKIPPSNSVKTVALTVMRNHKEVTIEVAMAAGRRSEAMLDCACYTA